MTIDDVPVHRPGRSKGVFLVLIIAAIGLLIGLGTWQLDRLAWKEALIAERLTGLAAPPMPLTNDRDRVKMPPYRRVTVTGMFLHDKERLVGPRTHRGMAGWHVVTPMRLESGGIVLVNRGWVPEDRKNPASRRMGQVAGRVTIEGVVKQPSKRGRFVPENDPAADQWFEIDPAAIAQFLRLTGVTPYWVTAGPAANPGGLPKGGQSISMPTNNHLQYAVTWYGLALVLAVCSVVYWRRD
jgi:surfeit locus 1 family protein